jgi:D-aminopeptidase
VRRFVPRLVSLDDRCLPTVTAGIIPGTTILQVTGDDTANAVQITDDATAGVITVTGDGVTQTFDATAVESIVVNTLGGDDAVEYDLTGALATTRLVSVDLGQGDDTFTADVSAQVSGAGTNLGISAAGGHGADTFVLNAQGTTVSAEARMSVDFSGDAGHDSITFNYDPGFLDLGNVTLAKDQKH